VFLTCIKNYIFLPVYCEALFCVILRLAILVHRLAMEGHDSMYHASIGSQCKNYTATGSLNGLCSAYAT